MAVKLCDGCGGEKLCAICGKYEGKDDAKICKTCAAKVEDGNCAKCGASAGAAVAALCENCGFGMEAFNCFLCHQPA